MVLKFEFTSKVHLNVLMDPNVVVLGVVGVMFDMVVVGNRW